jgi:hypothetical protein
VALGLAWSLAGCGPSNQGAEAQGPVSGPNRKLLSSKRFESEEYKKMIGADGKPVWQPGQLPKK